jgi:menaquinone-dependent protoporphyrinogen oxidase
VKVLVAAGSKYGSTRDVALAITQELASAGCEVDYSDASDVLSVTAYDAVIVGSAVYGGLWRRDAEEFIGRHAEVLAKRDVWTFSVGIETVVTDEQPHDEAPGLARSIGAHEHRRFAGALDPAKLNVGERALLTAINPPLGDFRDFEDVRAWAREISEDLAELATS